ncbi:MAG: ABC transporter permease [Myxococcota bacterium]
MWKYIARKLLLIVPLVWCVVTLIFVLIELSPGDVADKFFTPETPPEVRTLIVAKYHLDDPSYVRYLAMLRNLVLFDFGRSMTQERPVFEMIAQALPNTILLSLVTLGVVYPTAIVTGTIQAVRHNGPVDTTLSVGTLVLYSMPAFWLGLMLQLLMSYYWSGWVADQAHAGTMSRWITDLLTVPSAGMMDPVQYDFMSGGERLVDRLKHLILPGVAMGLAEAGGIARYMRSALLEVIRKDFVRTARAKGMRERTVVIRHALRNALLPLLTLLGLSMPALFSGSVLIETIFAWPGMGRLIISAIYAQDTPVIIATFYVFTLLVVFGNLLADIAYAWADPRIKYD